MVSDPTLREIISANPLPPVPRADLQTSRLGDLCLLLGPGQLEQPGSQDLQGLGTGLVLRLLILASDHHAGRQAGDPHGRIGSVPRLPAWTGGAEDIDPEFLGVDL